MKIKALLYCTKAKPYLVQGVAKPMHTLDATNPFNFNWKLVKKGFSNDRLNGKIAGECDYEIEWCGTSWYCSDFIEHKGLEKSCLTKEQLFDYIKGKNMFYAIHIKNLHIFDKPRELSDYVTKQCQFAKCSTCKYGKNNILCSTINIPITKAPQNMMYCYGKNTGEKYILISIQPEWLCKILNGEKTIEVRKVVLKEMINNE